MTVDLLMKKWAFKPIRNCPGRYVLSPSEYGGPPEQLLGPGFEMQEFQASAARDTVIVAAFSDGGGLISYRDTDGTHVHTVNTTEGFARKLRDLGIVPGSGSPQGRPGRGPT
jgi:hypothetical protein